MKKNILFFTRNMGLGGTENVILQLCEIMIERYNVIVCSSGGVNEEKLKRMGIKHYTVPDIEDKSLSTVLEIFRNLNLILKNEKIDIVHTHHRMAGFYISLFKRVYHFKFFATVHNTFLDKRMLTRLSYSGAAIVAVGEQVKKNLCEFYKINPNRITVIKNAVKPFEDKVEEDVIIKRYKNEGNYIVGNIGRLSEQKGMKYFIEAIPIVLDRVPNVKFFIIGEGEEKEMLRNIINNNVLEANVIFLGYRKDVQNIMSQLDLIVLSSLWEGLPLTPIEAFSVKKTVIATAVDGTVEIVKNNQNGITVKSKDSISLGNAIIKLLKNNELREQYEENAFKTYEKEFSFKALINNYRSFYEEN